MKATIAKDNNFNTIGLEVTNNDGNNTLFSWGVSPMVEFHFVKEIDTKKYETEILQLVQYREQLRNLNNFVSRFFHFANESDALKKSKDGKGTVAVKFGEIYNEISNIKRIMAEIIQKFI